MGKSEELLRLERALNEHPELREKLDAEVKRIAEAGEAVCDGDVLVKAAASLGYTITMEELERSAASLEKLDDDELEASGGGLWSRKEKSVNDPKDKGCSKAQKAFTIAKNSKDEKGREGACFADWHCSMALKHSDSKTRDKECWSDYLCYYISKDPD